MSDAIELALPREMFKTVLGLLKKTLNVERMRLVYFDGPTANRSAPEYDAERNQSQTNFDCLKELVDAFEAAKSDSSTLALTLTERQVWVIWDVLSRARRSEKRKGTGSGTSFRLGARAEGGDWNQWQVSAEFFDEILKLVPEPVFDTNFGIDLRQVKERRRNTVR